MSADNWGICPKCAKKLDRDFGELEKQIEQSYGKVPQNENLSLVEKLDAMQTETEDLIGRKLREDYEAWMDCDGIFHVSYGCACYECDFYFEYAYTEKVNVSSE